MRDVALPQARVAYVPGATFFPLTPRANHARLNFSAPSLEAIRTGIAALGKALHANPLTPKAPCPSHCHTPPATDLTAAEIARWRAIPVAIAVDLVREAGQIDPAIRPLRPAGLQPRLFGQAVTVRCEAPDFGAVLQALDVIQRGQVLMIDAGGYREAAMIGDILSGHLRAKGVAGVVCDGAVRDVGTLGALG